MSIDKYFKSYGLRIYSKRDLLKLDISTLEKFETVLSLVIADCPDSLSELKSYLLLYKERIDMTLKFKIDNRDTVLKFLEGEDYGNSK
jgi:hypothetical protein